MSFAKMWFGFSAIVVAEILFVWINAPPPPEDHSPFYHSRQMAKK